MADRREYLRGGETGYKGGELSREMVLSVALTVDFHIIDGNIKIHLHLFENPPAAVYFPLE
ncbi:hypothetical protein VKA52_13580 [Halobacillus sp. HZG1]|nr:hypothetical protein [Halobacillus sp. HZG1]